MSKVYAQQKKPHETAGVDSAHQAVPAFSNQAMLDLLKAPENVRAKPLSQEMHEKMSQHFGVSLSGVKVFENENLNQLGETAFAHGNEIHVAKGQYAPGTAHGQEVLMHEAAHVVQQGMGLAHDTGSESAALEAQAQSVQAGGSMGSISGFSMPAATASAPVQGFGRRLLKKLKGIFQKKNQPQAAPQAPEMSGKQKVATNILKSYIMQNNAGPADMHNRAMKGYLEALQLQEEYKNDPSKEIQSMYKQNKVISMDEFNQEVARTKQGLEYYINLCNTGITMKDEEANAVNLSGLDEDAMLDNAVKAQGVMADFPGLDVRAIRGVDTYSEGGDLPDEALMGATSGYDRMVQINNDLWKPGGERSSLPGWSAAEENYTLTHELGHMTNYHLADQFNKERDGKTPLYSDQVSRAIMAEALSDQAQEDENLRKILYANAGLDEKAELTDQASVRAISDALAPVSNPKNSQEKSQLMQALLAANYTSGYGSADPLEMYAEAFAAHYENQDAGEHAKNSPAAQLGRHIVNRSKDLFHSKRRRNSFAQRHWG